MAPTIPIKINNSIILLDNVSYILYDVNMKDKEKIKSAYDMTDDEVAKSVDLEVSDFDDSGDMLDELRDIMEGNDD